MSKLLSAVRNGTAKFPKSKRGAMQQHGVLIRAYMRAYRGGGMFGYDTRTMAAQERECFDYLTRLGREFAGLPS